MPATTVEEYLAGVQPDQRKALEHARRLVRTAAPDAVESISYGMIGYKLDGKPLVYLGAAKAHLGIYGPIQHAIQAFPEALAGRHTSKGTIRFTPEDPLPDEVVTAIVEHRVEAIRPR